MGVSDVFGVPGPAFGGGPSGRPLASGPVPGAGEDRGAQAGEWVVCAGGTVSAVPAGSVGCDVGADEAEDAGEGDQGGVDAAGCSGAGGRGGRDVVDEQECPCFLAGEVGGLAAEGAPRAPDGFLQ